MKNSINYRPLATVRERERELYFKGLWSKGGSREHRDVVILPRDCE